MTNKHTKIYSQCPRPVHLLQRPERQIKCRSDRNHYPNIFEAFDGDTNLCIFPRDFVLVLVYAGRKGKLRISICSKVSESCPTLCDPRDSSPPRLLCPWNSPGKNTGVGSHSLLQEIFPTEGLNPGLPHCKRILYCLSHQGSPRILEWVDYSFSSESSQPRSRTGISCIAGGFFTS